MTFALVRSQFGDAASAAAGLGVASHDDAFQSAPPLTIPAGPIDAPVIAWLGKTSNADDTVPLDLVAGVSEVHDR
jgi:hypothetical protein